MQVDYKDHFPLMPSTLTFPGPSNRIVRKAARYKEADSPSPKTSMLVILKMITHIVMINGIVANLVNKPRMIKSPQNQMVKELLSHLERQLSS